ncbi:hypothetical protein UA08_09256 [Talaromyces atroroseus]|uniref:Uncharacterized protein n=1 Tax=Talaromyces atroroseus TaxID=1441469 RepID=A0A1Q5Q6N8_TALAT|nr:hypothetical protein UA08_09256 [Talaromyces atroroseus]OKL55509.1 hypothetical protein UA08_09256 [Talaromyces atroroseus]
MKLLISTILIGIFATIGAVEADDAWQQLTKGFSDISTLSALKEAAQTPFNTTDTSSRAQRACGLAKLLFHYPDNRDAIPGYITQQSTLYLNITRHYWSDNCWQNTSCIVSPMNAREVARIMAIVRFTQTRFSVRSGGHDFNVNHSSTNHDGILINVANFNSISLSADKGSLTVGVGSRWGAVYSALNGTGVSVNGARSPNPAVGGQTLGGGIGWFTNQAGVTAASVIAAEVVLANSSRLGANDTNANIVYQLSEDTTEAQSFVAFLYLNPNVHGPSVFSPFDNINPAGVMINATVGTVADLTANFDTLQYPDAGVPPSRDYVVSLPHTVDKATYQESYTAFAAYAKQAMIAGWSMAYGAQPISMYAVRESSNTPLNLSDVDQDWFHVTAQWTSPDDDGGVMQLIHHIGSDIAASASRDGASLAYRFMNDAYDGQNVLSGYGEGNLGRLREIANKYDPEERNKRGTKMAPHFIFGTATLGMDQTQFHNAESVTALLQTLETLDIYRLDTGTRYPPLNPGRSEQLIGEVSKELGSKFTVDTKIYTDTKTDGSEDLSSEAIQHSVNASLRRLQRVEGVNVLYVHRPDPATPLEEQIEEFNRQISQGHCKALFLDLCEHQGWQKPNCYQGNYNLITRGMETRLLPILRANGISHNAFQPLAAGFLTGKLVNNQHDGTRFGDENPLGKAAQKLFEAAELLDAMKTFDTKVKACGLSSLDVAIRWIAHHSALSNDDGIILGASKTPQISEMVEMARKGSLPAKVLDLTEELWDAVKEIQGQII